METLAYQAPNPENFPARPETVRALVKLIDVKAEGATVGRYEHVARYEGELDGDRVFFALEQFQGGVRVLDVVPMMAFNDEEDDYRHGYDKDLANDTRYSFWPAQDGSITVKKELPFDGLPAFKKVDTEAARAHTAAYNNGEEPLYPSNDELRSRVDRIMAKTRMEEWDLGLTDVDEEETQALIQALQESKEFSD